MAKKNMTILERSTLGDCGEYYVAFYLSSMGHKVAITKRNTEKTDIIVTPEPRATPVSIQVKTGQYSDTHVRYKRNTANDYWVWRVGKSAMKPAEVSHWYAFLFIEDWIHNKGAPEVFFVPSKLVSKRTRKNDKLYDQGVWFDMSEEEARIHRGLMGYKLLRKAIEGK